MFVETRTCSLCVGHVQRGVIIGTSCRVCMNVLRKYYRKHEHSRSGKRELVASYIQRGISTCQLSCLYEPPRERFKETWSLTFGETRTRSLCFDRVWRGVVIGTSCHVCMNALRKYSRKHEHSRSGKHGLVAMALVIFREA